jgi:hypothetical protein
MLKIYSTRSKKFIKKVAANSNVNLDMLHFITELQINNTSTLKVESLNGPVSLGKVRAHAVPDRVLLTSHEMKFSHRTIR